MPNLSYYALPPSVLKKSHYGTIIVLEFPVTHLPWCYLLISYPFAFEKKWTFLFLFRIHPGQYFHFTYYFCHHPIKELLCPVLINSKNDAEFWHEPLPEGVPTRKCGHSKTTALTQPEISIQLRAHMHSTSGGTDSLLPLPVSLFLSSEIL